MREGKRKENNAKRIRDYIIKGRERFAIGQENKRRGKKRKRRMTHGTGPLKKVEYVQEYLQKKNTRMTLTKCRFG